jgi:hypothetical protein
MEDVTHALYPSADRSGIAHVAFDQLHCETVEICLCRLSAHEHTHAEPGREKRPYDRGSDEARGSRHEGKIIVRHWHHRLKPPLPR